MTTKAERGPWHKPDRARQRELAAIGQRQKAKRAAKRARRVEAGKKRKRARSKKA